MTGVQTCALPISLLRASSWLLSDAETRELGLLLDALRAVVAKQPTRLTLDATQGTLTLDRDWLARAGFDAVLGDVAQLEAELCSRLGRDDEAVSALLRATATCQTCIERLPALTQIALRAGRTEVALELALRFASSGEERRPFLERTRGLVALRGQWAAAQGEERAILETRFWIATGAWGRAWRSMASLDQDAASLDPELRRTVAEIAFRSGHRARAEQLLRGASSTESAWAARDQWEREMRWVDAPSSP